MVVQILKTLTKGYKIDKERRLFLKDFIPKQNVETKKLVSNKKNMFYRRCPLCNSDNYTKLFYAPIYTFVKCNKCRLVYSNYILNLKLIDKLYKESRLEDLWWKFEYLVYLQYIKAGRYHKRYNNTLKKILKHAPNNHSLLDIGCSFGALLREAKPHFKIVEGIELNKKTSELARKLGIRIYTKPLGELKFQKKYDVVVMTQLLEHVVDFRSLLKKVYRILNKGGILYIATPNVDSLALRLFKEKHVHVFDRFHVDLFNKKTISKLAELTNFKVLEVNSDNTLDITLNDLLFYTFNKKGFIHRANYNSIISPISFFVSLLINRFFNKTNILRRAGKGAFLEAILQKV